MRVTTRKAAPPPPPPLAPRKRPRDLSTEQACRRALAVWISDIERGDLEPKRANAMFFGVSILIGSFRDQRLEEIEKKIAELRSTAGGAP